MPQNARKSNVNKYDSKCLAHLCTPDLLYNLKLRLKFCELWRAGVDAFKMDAEARRRVSTLEPQQTTREP